MSEKLLELPIYPQSADVWSAMAECGLPLVIYGMGNGADKLIDFGEKKGIVFSDVFASDGFVRGHSFRGMRVKSFSEIKDEYQDFMIALSFASSRREVLDMIEEINRSYRLVAPDMPVAGGDYFTFDYYNSHYREIKQVYDLLGDDESKNIYSSVIHYKLTGDISYLLNNYSMTSDIYSLLPRGIETAVDLGAYNGDTVREAKEYIPTLKKVYAFEPDSRNYKKLKKYASEETDVEIIAKNLAAWSEQGIGSFASGGNRNSSVNATASYKVREESIALSSVDLEINEKTDYVKYDVEGAEREALLGTSKTIKKYSPALLVSLYHRSEDIYSLPLLVHELEPEYKLYVRRTRCLPAWEIALIAVK
jgi:FkbM family methyltransferase